MRSFSPIPDKEDSNSGLRDNFPSLCLIITSLAIGIALLPLI